MSDLGRTLVLFGILLIVIGGAIMLFGRLGAPRMPGDIVVRRGGLAFYFPIITSILASVPLTIVLNLILRRR